MWTFNKDGFFSAVEHRDNPDQLMVRARCREDIQRLAGKLAAEVVHTPEADYAYRIIVSKSARPVRVFQGLSMAKLESQ